MKYFQDKAGESSQVQLLTLIPAPLQNLMLVFTFRLLLVSNISSTVWGSMEMMLWKWPILLFCQSCICVISAKLICFWSYFTSRDDGFADNSQGYEVFPRVTFIDPQGLKPGPGFLPRTQTDWLWTHLRFLRETVPVSIPIPVFSSVLGLKI